MSFSMEMLLSAILILAGMGMLIAGVWRFSGVVWILLGVYLSVSSVGKANPALPDCVPPAKPAAALQTQLSPPSGGAEFPAGLRAGGFFLGQI
jgi:hypothetical protein